MNIFKNILSKFTDATEAADVVVEVVHLVGLTPSPAGSSWKCDQCDSGVEVYLKSSYRDPRHIQYCRCVACIRSTVCCITILEVDPASNPDLPSHLFPGCGSDGASFRVTFGEAPPRQIIDDLLDAAVTDSMLNEYDEATGIGYFSVIDGDAPPVGTIVPLMAAALARA